MRIGRRDQAQELELRGIHVLELVDEDEGELGAEPLAKARVRLQELDGTGDEVAEVDQLCGRHPLLIGLEDRRERAQPLARARLRRKQERSGVDQVLLHQGDEAEHVVRERLRPAHLVQRAELLRVDVGKDLAHDDPFLETVHEQAVSVGRVVAQQSRAEAVERGDPGLAVVVAQPRVDAAGDLARGAVREREDEDPVATRDAFAHGLLVEVDQRMRLARAWSGQHAHWSIHFVDVDGHRVSRGWRRAT